MLFAFVSRGYPIPLDPEWVGWEGGKGIQWNLITNSPQIEQHKLMQDHGASVQISFASTGSPKNHKSLSDLHSQDVEPPDSFMLQDMKDAVVLRSHFLLIYVGIAPMRNTFDLYIRHRKLSYHDSFSPENIHLNILYRQKFEKAGFRFAFQFHLQVHSSVIDVGNFYFGSPANLEDMY